MTTELLEQIAAYPTADFTGKCGENSSATATKGLAPLQIMAINGSTDLQSCVVGNDGARVYSVTLMASPGIYDYVIQVDGQGPSGIFGGSWYLAFTDQSGDTYKLSLYSSTRSVHTVRYNSKLPSIMKFQWNNNPI
ncbi:hypothetical protein [Paracoccus sp. (in: a-proteobacteria)]|uniref:hypothetical protein n=1 Tax=Paracoccus sp. TaxID=267 RepID=UPI003A84F5FE